MYKTDSFINKKYEWERKIDNTKGSDIVEVTVVKERNGGVKKS